MRYSIFLAACFAAAGLAQNCGPAFGNQKCAAGNCCTSIETFRVPKSDVPWTAADQIFRQSVRMGEHPGLLTYGSH